MGRGFRLLKIFGFDVRADYSWLIIFFLILWTFTFGVFPMTVPGRGSATYLLMGSAATLLFFASIVVHELSHSLMARRKGIRVEGITLFVFGGLAHTRMEMEDPGDEFQIASVGPLSSVVLGLLFLAAAWTGPRAGWSPSITAVTRSIGYVNLMLAVFNLLPGFPLDGGRIFRAIVWKITGDLRKATRWASNGGKAVGYALIAIGVLNFFGGNLVGGLWMAFIGWFVRTAAEASYLELLVRSSLQEIVAEQVMTPEPEVVAADMPLREFIEERVLHGRHQSYPVVANGHPVGIITLDGVRHLGRDAWSRSTVRDAMVETDPDLRVDRQERMDHVLDRLRRSKARRVLVVDEDADRLAGIITQSDVARLLERWRVLDRLGTRAA